MPQVEAPDVHDNKEKNTTWWEDYWKELNGDLSTWNVYMHNGLQARSLLLRHGIHTQSVIPLRYVTVWYGALHARRPPQVRSSCGPSVGRRLALGRSDGRRTG